MLNKVLIFIALFCAGHAFADSWDSNANISRAVDKAITTYKSQGLAGLAAEAQNCYAGLDTSFRNKNVSRDVEYCVALEIASSKINHSGKQRHAYLDGGEVLLRAMLYLEKTRVIHQPDEFQLYLAPRIERINASMQGRI
jgi:hypothetical protein